MFGTAWLTLRQIREALRTGQLEEASRLLGQNGVSRHKKAFQLREEVVRGFLTRAQDQLSNDAPAKAWHDLQQAELLAPNNPDADKCRQTLLQLGLAEVRSALEAGKPGRAAETIARLRDRGVKPAELHPYDDAA